MKENRSDIVYICVQPNTLYYVWQVNLWLESAKEHNILDKCHILIYRPSVQDKWLEQWKIVEDLYPEARLFYYTDKGVAGFLKIYVPILRPHTLSQHFRSFPELSKKAIFYHDCDIILNRNLDIDKYLSDDINYVADTGSDYLSHQYFESKERDVLPEKLQEYIKDDILLGACDIVGISKHCVVENLENTGGAQYLLKGITYEFWDKVERSSLELVLYLKLVNRRYFESESKGYQAWCSDMWAVLWNLWAEGRKTKKSSEISFCWSTDTIDRLDKHPILHNAGVTSSSTIRTRDDREDGQGKVFVDAPAFYKGRYHESKFTPFNDTEYIENILNHPLSKGYCFYNYLEKIMKIKNKYSLKY